MARQCLVEAAQPPCAFSSALSALSAHVDPARGATCGARGHGWRQPRVRRTRVRERDKEGQWGYRLGRSRGGNTGTTQRGSPCAYGGSASGRDTYTCGQLRRPPQFVSGCPIRGESAAGDAGGTRRDGVSCYLTTGAAEQFVADQRAYYSRSCVLRVGQHWLTLRSSSGSTGLGSMPWPSQHAGWRAAKLPRAALADAGSIIGHTHARVGARRPQISIANSTLGQSGQQGHHHHIHGQHESWGAHAVAVKVGAIGC